MALYAYFCFVKFGMLPSQFDALDTPDKAMIIAMIRKYSEDKRKQEREIELKTKRK